MDSLNLLDKKIIYELENNSRQSLSRISRTLKTSQQVVSYRLQNLEKENIIKKYITIIDYTKLGYKSLFCCIKIKNVFEKNKLLLWLIKQEKTYWVCETQGSFSFVFSFLYKNDDDILKFTYNIKNNFYNFISNFCFFPIIDTTFFNKDYLFRKYRNAKYEKTIKNKISKKDLDELDLNILKNLSYDSKIATINLAKINNTTPEIIVEKIKKLNHLRVILGHCVVSDLKENVFLFLFKLKNSKNKELIDYLKNLKNVVFIMKILGEYEIVIKYESDNKTDVYKEINKINTLFCSTIEDINLLFLNKEHKINFFIK